LFEHYRKFLESVDILYYPKDDKKKKGDDGDGGKDKGEPDYSDMLEDFKKVKESKPYSAYSSKDAVAGELKDNTEFVVMDKSAKPCKYSPEIVKQANALVNLLDISFQPKEDRVENLKCGKMSSHKIAEIPAGNTHIYYRVEEDQATRPFSICVLADESGSMHGSPTQRQNDLMKMLYYAFSQILPQDKMFFLGHSGNPESHEYPEIRIYHDKYNQNFEHTIDNQLHNDFNENYDGPVIECIYERVREQTSDNIIFISISDGGPSGCDYGGPSAIKELKRVIEKCKRDGFVTVGIGLRYGKIKDIYNYHTIVMDMSKLVKSVSSLINQVVKTEFKD
jgi:cobalamin biosynthesis protein CobT